MSNDYNTAWDALSTTIGSAMGQGHGSIEQMDHLTTDQRLKVIEISALLSIAQEISSLNPNNTIQFDGEKRVNGWGFPIPGERG